MSLKASILLVLVGTAYSLRCQCSSEAGGVRCYNGWCDVQDFGGKVGACALVRVGTRQHFACVRVKPTSQDTCKVDQKNGETLVLTGWPVKAELSSTQCPHLAEQRRFL